MTPELIRGLKEERSKWERGDVIFHKESLSSGSHISICSTGSMFSVHRYFTAGDNWNTSCDGEFQKERNAWQEAMTNFS